MVPIVASPNTAYATKDNIAFPGTVAQATAARAQAKSEIESRAPKLTVTVAAGAIVGS